jgi:hypothetical protein
VTSREPRIFSKRLLDLCRLIGAALIVCVLGVGAFAITDAYNINPMWVLLSFISVGFFAMAREDYRKEFRSVRFLLFVCGWAVINMAVIVIVLGFLGWLYLIPILFLEQVLFYMTAYWLFGLEPPLRRGRPKS